MTDINNDPTHLRQVIYKLQTDLEDIEIEKAEQQLTGYAHAKRGFGLKELVDSMGLTKKEWKEISFSAKCLGLTDDMISEIDAYFRKEKVV